MTPTLLSAALLLAAQALGGETAAPVPASAPDASVRAGTAPSPLDARLVAPRLDAALDLPARIGAPWQESVRELFGLRCLPEESLLFEAMDCPSDFSLGPFTASGPEGDGITVIADDGATVSRVTATRKTGKLPQACDAFLEGVSRALAKSGFGSTIERGHDLSRLRTSSEGDVVLTVDCQPRSQSLRLEDAWLHIVPHGNCPNLGSAPAELRAMADTAMTKVVHDDPSQLGTACNRPGYVVNEFAGRLMVGLMVAYQSVSLALPASPPNWLVGQIQGGFADARRQGAALPAASRQRLGAYLDRETNPARLGSLWSRLRKQGTAPDAEPVPLPPHAPAGPPQKAR